MDKPRYIILRSDAEVAGDCLNRFELIDTQKPNARALCVARGESATPPAWILKRCARYNDEHLAKLRASRGLIGRATS